jgi:hypothetical protein
MAWYLHIFICILRTKIKSRKDGKASYTYRLVESIRTQKDMVGTDQKKKRQIIGQMSLSELPAEIEKASQYFAGMIIQA